MILDPVINFFMNVKRKLGTYLLHQHHAKMYADMTFISILAMQKSLIMPRSINSKRQCLAEFAIRILCIAGIEINVTSAYILPWC